MISARLQGTKLRFLRIGSDELDRTDWGPIQIFRCSPLWLQIDEERGHISIGCEEPEAPLILITIPEAEQMSDWVKAGTRVRLPALSATWLSLSRAYVDTIKITSV